MRQTQTLVIETKIRDHTKETETSIETRNMSHETWKREISDQRQRLETRHGDLRQRREAKTNDKDHRCRRRQKRIPEKESRIKDQRQGPETENREQRTENRE